EVDTNNWQANDQALNDCRQLFPPIAQERCESLDHQKSDRNATTIYCPGATHNELAVISLSPACFLQGVQAGFLLSEVPARLLIIFFILVLLPKEEAER